VQPVGTGVAVFGRLGLVLVPVGVVGLADTRHRHVQRCAACIFAQHGVAGVGGDALGRVHRDGIPVGDVLTHIVAAEDGGPVGQSTSGDPVAVGVDGGHPPTISIAHRISRRHVVLSLGDPHRGVVAPADDQIAHCDALSASFGDSGRQTQLWLSAQNSPRR